MNITIQNRSEFLIAGYRTETSLFTCRADIGRLWETFAANKHSLFSLYGTRENFYGVMWKTGIAQDRYFYFIGIDLEKSDAHPKDFEVLQIPLAKYAVASIPSSQSAVEAWTEFYETALPKAGFVPADGHVFDFEYYPHGAEYDYELWTPIQQRK